MNLLLVTNTDLNSDAPWYLARAVAEFGHLNIVAAIQNKVDEQTGAFSLVEPELPHKHARYPDASFYHVVGATMSECVQLALTTPNWLPPIDVVLIGGECGKCFGTSVWLSAHMQAAFFAYELGVPAFTLFQIEGTPQQWNMLSYAAERLLRSMLELPRLPRVVLRVNIPNVRPNKCEGFAVVKAERSLKAVSYLDRASTPWTFHSVEDQAQDPVPGTDRWAVRLRQVAVTPFWGWGTGDLAEQLETMAVVSTAVARMGSSRAYRAAVVHTLEREVKYQYHFKGGVLSAESGACIERSAARFAYEVDPIIEKPILEHAFGRVLDVGCGSGRIAVYLMTERRDYVTEVVGIDSNPVSLRDYEQRWTQAVSDRCITHCLDVQSDDLSPLGLFDTILLFGDTLGIGENSEGMAKLLRHLRKLVSAQGRLIATGRDPLKTHNPDEQLINEDNLRHGLGAGERFLRITFEHHDTGWFQFYYASLEELREQATAAGWRLMEQGTYSREPDQYGVVLEAI
ncbi:MAG: methyltransferase domain-containing protein [Chloroflexota bacterium]|nr:methyltransferase domain-containing protein [Chloroflexota bacterium]